ncbi:MAG TPA: hypothetical protein VL282_11840 [Tepidisphaeraceae bacterium]|jgi:hypothetical protein|nr:hypothetical protein [Tepidisphaeraceae bacterium]
MVPLVLASNFDGMIVWVLAVPAVLVAGAALSYVASARGHWAGIALAAPVAGLGGLFFLSIAIAHAPAWIVVLSLVPFLIAVGSIALWVNKRGQE